MAAWLEHADFQLQAVDQAFLAVKVCLEAFINVIEDVFKMSCLIDKIY